MFFTNPIWLWALSGLSIPVAIHLLSRKEGQVIYIGSIRHLQETSTQQFKGIRLNELLLLALRCLLIILFVLLLSGLSFHKEQGNEAPWVLIEKGLENSREVNSQLEKFKDDGYEVRSFTSGFPFLADSVEDPSPILYRKLIEELRDKDFSEAIIFSKNRVEGFSGLQSSLPANVRWISVPSESKDYQLTSTTTKDGATIRTGHTSSEKTYFTSESLPPNSEEATDSIKTILISLISDRAHEFDKKIIEASLKAIEETYSINIEIVNSNATKSDWLISLTGKPTQAEFTKGRVDLLLSIENEIIIQKTETQWTITKRLNEEVALNENLTLRLASIIIPAKESWELATTNDLRMLPDSLAWNNEANQKGTTSLQSQSATTYLIALLILTLLLERVISYNKNQ